MPERVKGTPKMVKCLIEEAVRNCGFFELVHDGGVGWNNPELGESRLQTRVYRMKLDGIFVRTWVRFKYDYRRDLADVSISYGDLAELEKQVAKMNSEQESGNGSRTMARRGVSNLLSGGGSSIPGDPKQKRK